MEIECDVDKIGYLLNHILKPIPPNVFPDVYQDTLAKLSNRSMGTAMLTLDELKRIYKDFVRVKNNRHYTLHFLSCGIYLSDLLDDYDMEQAMKPFDTELEDLINKHGIDNDCGVPDYILAAFMVQSLEPLKSLVNMRDKHLQVAEPQYTTLTSGKL